MEKHFREIQTIVNKTISKLQRLNEADVNKIPVSDKWSRKKILGHLIDLAANNHRLIRELQQSKTLIFPIYE